MDRSDVLARLRAVVERSTRQAVDWNAVTAESPIESLGFDSLSILDLIYDIQQEFGMEFEIEALAGIRTVGDLADFLRNRLR